MKLTKEEQIKLVSKRGSYIKLIDEPCDEAIDIAIKDSETNIRYIKNPTNKRLKEIIIKDSANIDYIENPSEELQLLAVRDRSSTIRYIKNPTKKYRLNV